jgi:hypothetical protein
VRGKSEPLPSSRRGRAPSRERPRRDRARRAAHRRVRMSGMGTDSTSYRRTPFFAGGATPTTETGS